MNVSATLPRTAGTAPLDLVASELTEEHVGRVIEMPVAGVIVYGPLESVTQSFMTLLTIDGQRFAVDEEHEVRVLPAE